MNYYKVTRGGTVIDAGFMFLKWSQKHRCMFACDASEAQFIQSSDQAQIWRVGWLNPAPTEAGTFETVEAVEITEEEYLTIRQQLDEGEEIPDDPEPVPEEPTEEEDNPDEEPQETVMSVAEMRRRIASLEEQLQEQAERNDFLEGCLLEMSEIVYDG